MRILVVEDNFHVAQAINFVLAQRGHDVTNCSGFDTLPDQGTAVARLFSSPDSARITFADYQAAFLDYALETPITGVIVMPALAEAGVHTCAISNLETRNEEIVRAGAITSCLKGDVVVEIERLLARLS